jgi:F-type H+-transporting ATPase subunit alpha
MAVSLFAANEGYLDDVEVEKVVDFEKALHDYMNSQQKALMDKISSDLKLTDEITSGLHEALKDFKANHAY